LGMESDISHLDSIVIFGKGEEVTSVTSPFLKIGKKENFGLFIFKFWDERELVEFWGNSFILALPKIEKLVWKIEKREGVGG